MRRCFLFLLLLATATGQAAEAPPQRPRIGLVLSGGGALGSAHVGVIKVFEELRIPIDCIAGTSMGAVVGGMYAAGMTPAEMEEFLVSTDWRDLFDDRPPRRHIPFRRKVDDLTYLTRFEAGFNHGSFQLPSSLVAGQKFGFLLQAMTVHTVGIPDFDHLPIPFRTVATDIESGDAVVLQSGDLGRAIRASMSVPGIFAPIEIDGHLLVDGGLVNNLPVDLALEMGADVVIAVDVGMLLRTREKLSSISQVTGQVVDMMVRGNVNRTLPLADVVVRPDLTGFSSTDFEKAVAMIARGEEAAKEPLAAVAELSLGAEEYALYLESLRSREDEQRVVQSVQLTISSTADPDLVLRQVRTRPGMVLDVNGIRSDLERLYELGDYERVDFFLSKIDGGYALHIEAHEKSWGPNYLRFGLNLSSDLEGDSTFNVLANYTMTRLNRLRGEAKFAAQMGEQPTFYGELYQPLQVKPGWFVTPWFERTTFRATDFGTPSLFGDYKIDLASGGLDLGYQLGRWGELRFGLTRGRGRAEQRRGPDELPSFSFDWAGYTLRGVIDQLDNPNFPRNGFIVGGDLLAARENLGSDADYERLELYFTGARSLGKHTLLGSLALNSALGSSLPIWDRFSLGGLFRLSGVPQDSINGQYTAGATTNYYYRFARLPSGFGDGLYAGLSLEAGNAWEDSGEADLADLVYAGSLFVGADTVLGPVYLAWGYADTGDSAWYLYVGRSF